MTAPPRVLLLIGGDASSLGEVRTFYDSGGFIVAAQDSGGLAAVLAEYALTLTTPPSWVTHKDAIAYAARGRRCRRYSRRCALNSTATLSRASAPTRYLSFCIHVC